MPSDNFNRADAATLGANWTQAGWSGATLGITSNQAAVKSGSESSYCFDLYTAVSAPATQYSQVVVKTVANVCVVCCRMASGGTQSYYGGGVNPTDGPDSNTRIFKLVSGTYTSLANFGSNSLSVNDVIKLTVIGNSLSFYRNNVLELTASDSALSTGEVGLGAVHSSAVEIFDDWAGGEIPKASGIVPRPVFGTASDDDGHWNDLKGKNWFRTRSGLMVPCGA